MIEKSRDTRSVFMPNTSLGNGNGLRRNADDAVEAVLAQVRELLDGVRFGSITLVVQDGVVVQIDRTEKRRLQPSARRLETPFQAEATADPPPNSRRLPL
jgi:hypothetical protein